MTVFEFNGVKINVLEFKTFDYKAGWGMLRLDGGKFTSRILKSIPNALQDPRDSQVLVQLLESKEAYVFGRTCQDYFYHDGQVLRAIIACPYFLLIWGDRLIKVRAFSDDGFEYSVHPADHNYLTGPIRPKVTIFDFLFSFCADLFALEG